MHEILSAKNSEYHIHIWNYSVNIVIMIEVYYDYLRSKAISTLTGWKDVTAGKWKPCMFSELQNCQRDLCNLLRFPNQPFIIWVVIHSFCKFTHAANMPYVYDNQVVDEHLTSIKGQSEKVAVSAICCENEELWTKSLFCRESLTLNSLQVKGSLSWLISGILIDISFQSAGSF